MTTVADAVVARLRAAGLQRAYTVPGESFLPLLHALHHDDGIALVSTRHESGAGFMAEADAKLTGIPAAVLATRGVGAANLAVAVHTARQDSTPMVVLLGQVESAHLEREAFQEVDLPAFYAEITKWSATATSRDRVPELVDRALHAAVSGRPGPAMVALPADLLEGEVTPGGWAPGAGRTAAPAMSAWAAEAVARTLQEASRPVMIAGGGAQRARESLVALADRFGVGVYASFRRQDVFPNDHPCYCGHLTLGTPPETLEALEAADVVLVVGARLSEITTQGYTLPRPDQRVLQIDIDPASVGAVRHVEVGCVADAATAVPALLEHAPARPQTRSWTSAHQAYLTASTPPAPAPPERPVHPADVIAALARTFSSSTVITNDAGNFSVFGHRYWRFTEARTQLGPTSGAMGYAVPAAVAAKLAAPQRDVVALVGDGGFLMTGQELETAVRHGAALTTIVFRNGLYGTIALHQARGLRALSAVDIGAVDLAAVARGYGAQAWTVRAADDLDEALLAARQCAQPALLDVLVDPDVLTPSARLSELVDDRSRP